MSEYSVPTEVKCDFFSPSWLFEFHFSVGSRNVLRLAVFWKKDEGIQ